MVYKLTGLELAAAPVSDNVIADGNGDGSTTLDGNGGNNSDILDGNG